MDGLIGAQVRGRILRRPVAVAVRRRTDESLALLMRELVRRRSYQTGMHVALLQADLLGELAERAALPLLPRHLRQYFGDLPRADAAPGVALKFLHLADGVRCLKHADAVHRGVAVLARVDLRQMARRL